jgi:hypothetical protein
MVPGTRIAEAIRRQQIINAAYALATGGGLVIFHFLTKDRLVLALLRAAPSNR